jgi:endo-1,4-beta-D-glucanase Y
VRRRVIDVLTIVGAVALVAVAGLTIAGCGGSGGGGGKTSTTTTAQTPEQRAEAAARHFLNLYVDSDGRVVRRDQGGDTVGEGQAYGMLLAAAIGDRRRFDKIWTWTQQNIRRPDGLLSFLWQNGHVVKSDAASDADLDATRALLVAACRFNHPEYRREAIQLGDAILKVEVGSATFQGEPVLTAGNWAITPPPVTVDPSYFAPASFLALRAASKDPRWGALAASSRAITAKLIPAPGRLPPDWAHLQGDTPVPIFDPSHPQKAPVFGFDAVRTLVRFAEDPNPAGRRIVARSWLAFENQDPNNLPVYHELSGKPVGDVRHPVALVAAAGAADAAGQTAARDGLLDAAERLDQNKNSATYYGAAWVALGRMFLTTKLLDPTCS